MVVDANVALGGPVRAADSPKVILAIDFVWANYKGALPIPYSFRKSGGANR